MLRKMKIDRLERTFEVLSSINPYIAKEVITSKKAAGKTEKACAAIKIQKVYRGHVARKHFAKLLFEYYQKLEEEEMAARAQQVEEGLRAIQARIFEDRISDKEFIERQRKLRRTSAAITIQRRFRKHLKDPKRKVNVVTKKVDKYAKYREIINTPIKDFEEDEKDGSGFEFESYIAKVAGVNLQKTKTLAKQKAEEDEKREAERKAGELVALQKRHQELIKLVEQRSEKLRQVLEERADILAALEEQFDSQILQQQQYVNKQRNSKRYLLTIGWSNNPLQCKNVLQNTC
eukprot:TRINITY_DN122014_c0_g1_i1.p1 TRINITY_DN122014_c0_g1~~TRINITY_DN122014_c0_g1_i1.p1  ORF type:complete len:320 (+),score=42.21 TRINITY_DN122014_c0_g1_i1:93-962(+)